MTARRRARRRRGRGRSGELTYYAPPEPPPQQTEAAPEPRQPLHGYTLADIHDLARKAASANRWLVSDFTIRYEHAWDAITETLLTSARPLTPHELAAHAKGAVSRWLLKDFCHTYGVADRDLTAGIGSAPRFAAYWFRPPATPMDETIAERIALGQVWAMLSDRERDVLTALAASSGTQAAADALGMPRSSYRTYVSWARDRFEELWYDHETPPQAHRKQGRYTPSDWNTSRQAECGTPGAYRRHKRNGEPIDVECAEANKRHERERKSARRAAA